VRRFLAVVALVAVGVGVVTWVVVDQPAWYLRLRYPFRYQAIVEAHARNYRLDPALLASVIYTESKFHADARSRSGAIGLMQLLPSTAEGIALHTGGTRFRVSDLYTPEINIRYGSWYLRHLLDRYGDERTALAAYNAGQDNVDRWSREGVGIEFPETRNYVERVEDLKSIYRKAYPAALSGTAHR
jgi:peptidoglycan lytic transglycosylase